MDKLVSHKCKHGFSRGGGVAGFRKAHEGLHMKCNTTVNLINKTDIPVIIPYGQMYGFVDIPLKLL